MTEVQGNYMVSTHRPVWQQENLRECLPVEVVKMLSFHQLWNHCRISWDFSFSFVGFWLNRA